MSITDEAEILCRNKTGKEFKKLRFELQKHWLRSAFAARKET